MTTMSLLGAEDSENNGLFGLQGREGRENTSVSSDVPCVFSLATFL